MGFNRHDIYQVTVTGASTTLGAASAGGTLPNNSTGSTARYCRFATTTGAYVRVGNGAQTAVATDILVLPNEAVVLDCSGCTHYAGLQAATGGVLVVTPVEV